MEELLRIEHLHKSFGPTHANNDICMTLNKGEIRALAGENGSGKSTLSSIICGMQPFDEGRMILNGNDYRPGSPIDANGCKVSMVVQELGVITSLTGAMNIFLGKTDRFKKAGLVNTRAMEKEAQEIFDKWELGKLPLNIPCAHLTMEQRKIVELARALYAEPDLLILDEITQSLSHDTRGIIYRLKERFKKENRSMIIITHDLEETVDISDTITVLRDGEVINTVASKDITLDDLKQMMVGRKMEGDYLRGDKEQFENTEELLRVEHLSLADHKIDDISFALHRGEILGVCGLSDAGIHTLGSAVFGISDARRSGAVIDVKSGKRLKSPSDMLACKGAYLSKNRDEEGLMMVASISNNLTLPSAKRLSRALGYISSREVGELARNIYRDYDVKANGVGQPIGRLSGGNKQKVNLGRWLYQDLDYVILDCPTRGVDIGVKAYIYDVLKKKKAEGLGVLLITDELSEAIGMADRIMVLKEGKLQKTLERPAFSESAIIEVMM